MIAALVGDPVADGVDTIGTQGVADGLALADPEGLADDFGEAVPDALGLVAGVPVGLAAGVALAHRPGLCGASRVALTDWPLPPPLSSRATGTTISPMKTVMTKATAPHSRRQKAALLLRIRALRPSPAAAYCAC
ncbi:MAG TPA: hypothetical protein VET65_04600 [Candidatus Limnocylindrales bacterium]|nr:hypothetical protein [Candidatus Limnocylindrales bacterium]